MWGKQQQQRPGGAAPANHSGPGQSRRQPRGVEPTPVGERCQVSPVRRPGQPHLILLLHPRPVSCVAGHAQGPRGATRAPRAQPGTVDAGKRAPGQVTGKQTMSKHQSLPEGPQGQRLSLRRGGGSRPGLRREPRGLLPFRSPAARQGPRRTRSKAQGHASARQLPPKDSTPLRLPGVNPVQSGATTQLGDGSRDTVLPAAPLPPEELAGHGLPAPGTRVPLGWALGALAGHGLPAPGTRVPLGWALGALAGHGLPAPGTRVPLGWALGALVGHGLPAPGTRVPLGWAGLWGRWRATASLLPAPGLPAPGTRVPLGWALEALAGHGLPAPGTRVPLGWALEALAGHGLPAPGTRVPLGWALGALAGHGLPAPGTRVPLGWALGALVGHGLPAPGPRVPLGWALGALAGHGLPAPGTRVPLGWALEVLAGHGLPAPGTRVPLGWALGALAGHGLPAPGTRVPLGWALGALAGHGLPAPGTRLPLGWAGLG
nr:basic proline-rich protein-like [Dasypus novemcinctus]